MTAAPSSLAPALAGRDLLELCDLSAAEIGSVLDLAQRAKAGDRLGLPLRGRAVAMLFQKQSMRTRVSFEVGISRLGGHPVVLADREIDLGVREPVADAARVLDRYVDAVVARLHRHRDMVELARHARVPVVNALTDRAHPCQVLGDLLTLRERFGTFSGLRLVFVGDGNNVASSLIDGAALMGFELTLVTPPGYEPAAAVLERARSLGAAPGRIRVTGDLGAVAGASAVYTDVWTSMGDEDQREARARAFAEYQVNSDLMASAPGAVFLHCLPAHRGEEVTDAVMEGPESAVFDQAENRLHAQMALLALLLPGAPAC